MRPRDLLLRGWVVAALLLLPTLALASGPAPEVRIPLEPLGYAPLLPEFLQSGNSLLTVDFVDNDHLLVTFALRKLLKRDLDPGPDDDDRMIAAVLLDLPGGKMMARTEFRVHDRARYLWNIGGGRFLLRIKDRLSVFAPMQGIAKGDAFRQEDVLGGDRHIVAILLSSNKDLLTVETTSRPGVQIDAEGAAEDHAPVQVNFYRLSAGEGQNLNLTFAGVIRTQDAVEFPMTSAGILNITTSGNNTWLFDFDEHSGKVDQLLAFDTSCAPRAVFVANSEFVVFGCRGSDDKKDFAGFNLQGDQMWQQNFFQTFTAPTFDFAPAAGRFALGRIIVSGITGSDLVPSGAVTGQDVRVYQTNSGKQLMKIDCTPIVRSGENFALSADGLRLAVIRQAMVYHPATKEDYAWTENSTGVEVYDLPPLTQQDRAAVQQAQKMAPPDTGARIDLALERNSMRQDAAENAGSQNSAGASSGSSLTDGRPRTTTDAEPGNPAMSMPAARDTAGGATAPVGDAGVDAPVPRKAPTLYQPGENPDEQKPQ